MYLTPRFFTLFAVAVVVTACGSLLPPLFYAGCTLLALLVMATGIEFTMLCRTGTATAVRQVSERFSNGDDNEVTLTLTSTYPMKVSLQIIDELPKLFQIRDFCMRSTFSPGETASLTYTLRPTERGVYPFGHIQVIVSILAGLVSRRITTGEPQDVKVYPAFMRLQRYEFATLHTNDFEAGNRKIRRTGNSTEFSQIKDYVSGDDYRKINWKASARRHQLMLNVYEEEKSQHIYSIIDTGRVMQQSFEGMTLLDHSVNATLVLSHIALKKGDNAGLATFSNKPGQFLNASHSPGHTNRILDMLYKIETDFKESDYQALSQAIQKKIHKRSLLILYTNFFSLDALRRQLPFLKHINRRHRLLVVFFEDNEQNDYIKSPATNTEEYFRHVIAEKYASDRRSITTLLQHHGIMALLTEPQSLTADVINKYIEIKSRNII